MSTVGADPDALISLGADAAPAATELRRGARRLTDAISRWNGSTQPPYLLEDGVVGAVGRLASALVELDEWAANVGEQLARADTPGARRGRARLLAVLLATAPGGSQRAAVVAALVELEAHGTVTRSDLDGLDVAELSAAGQDPALSFAARDLVNRAAMGRWLDEQPAPGSSSFRELSSEERHRIASLGAVLGEHDGGRLGQLIDGQPLTVLRFVPADGPDAEPTLQLFRGDPAAVDHVAVWVPGTTHGIHTLDEQLDVAEVLRVEAGAAASGAGRLGVVIDLYDAPDHLLLAVSNAGRTAFGEHHAPALVAAVDDARRLAGDGNVMALGHSYGSFALGRAAAAGLDADDIVLVGSPGTGERTADGFDLPATADVFVARAPRDPIDLPADLDEELWPGTTAVALGPDPADDDFGARVLEVNRAETTPDDPHYVQGHSAYLLEGSQSAANLATIALGGEPTVARAADAADRLREVDAVGPGPLDDLIAAHNAEYYGGTDVTRAAP